MWIAVVQNGTVLHFGKDPQVATHVFTQNQGSSLFWVQSLDELETLIKQPVSEQKSCCGGKSCCDVEDPLEEMHQAVLQSVQAVKETALDILKRVGVSEADLNEFTTKVKAGVDEISTNIKAGGQQAVENTKNIGQTLGGWFKSLGEKLSK